MPIVSISEGVAILDRGALLAIPTETVYGLAADATRSDAVAAIFRAKRRPASHPLILHARDPRPWAVFDARAEALSAFWPGPLTLVLPRRAGVPDAVTGGHDTVAVRVPAHPTALAILDAFGRPLAAPSANRFGEVSPTTAAHVLASFPDLPVVDGGPCTVGVESTIVDLSTRDVSILRPGGIPAEAIALALGLDLVAAGTTAAPGTLPVHYAPRARVRIVNDARDEGERRTASGQRCFLLPRTPPAEYARTLYARLREADEEGAEVILAEPADEVGIGVAVNDRLRRAAAAGADE